MSVEKEEQREERLGNPRTVKQQLFLEPAIEHINQLQIDDNEENLEVQKNDSASEKLDI